MEEMNKKTYLSPMMDVLLLLEKDVISTSKDEEWTPWY
jgi:hypothetical protein